MKKHFLSVLAALALSQGVQAQVSAYTFTQTTGSYAPATGTDLFGTSWNDNVSAALPIGFSFLFNSVPYSSVTVSSNGFVTFGATAPGAGNYLPLSNTSAYAGAISAFGRDLSANTGATGVSYTVTGTTPNRKFIVQWENAKRVAGDVVNFQIVLNETSNRVDVIYGACSATSSANTNKVQVGLRGATNADFNNRQAGNNVAWASTNAGSTNADNVNYKATVLPASGLTFSWLAPTCFPVSGFGTSGISTASATFSWTSGGSSFDVYYGPSSITAPSATTAPTATTSATAYTVTGLTPNTGYVFYVRNNCGGGDMSAWSPAWSYSTACTATNVPYVQDFESVIDPALPGCTSAENPGSGNIWITSAPFDNGFLSNTLTYEYNSTSAANTWFYTQGLNLTAGTSYRLTYRYGCADAGYTERMRVNYGTSPLSTAMTNTLANHPSITNDVTSITNTVDFTPSASGVYYIGFQAYSIADQFNLYVDDITVNLTPSCIEPTAAAIAAVTATSAVSTWTTAGSATAWDLYYGPSPLTAPTASTAPTATASANTYTLNGLTPSTGYSFYVRSHCSPTDQSTWTGPVSFFTPCLPPAISSVTSATRCGVGTATLGASSTGNLNWYAAATGGTAVATGSVFTTPTISSTTNYYVSASSPPGLVSAGITAPTGTLSLSPYDDGLRFDATQSFTLVSLDVYPNDIAGSITVDLYDNALNLVHTYSMPTPAATGSTAVTVPVNFDIPVGTGYYLISSSGPELMLNTSGVSYPYALSSVGSIFAGFDGFNFSDTQTEYFYFYNLKVSSICEGPRTMVTASVTPPPALSLSTGTTVCANVISTMSVTSTASNFNSYVWSPATGLYTDAAATVPYTGGSATNVYFKSAVNGPKTYTVTANNSTSQCANVANTTMIVDIPTIQASSNPTLICSGSTATLSASQIVVGTATLGAGASTTVDSDNSSGNSVSPYSHYYGGYKAQYILRASELTAIGIGAGNINSLGFNVTTAGTTYTDFSIKMAATTQSVMTTAFISPIPQVYGLSNVTPVVGINTYNFSTPFNWNGTSNIVVEVTWSNNNTGGLAGEVTYDATSYDAMAFYRDDNMTPAAIAAEATAENTRSFRPQLFINGQMPAAGAGTYSWQWNPGAVNSYSTSVSPTSTVSTNMSYTVNVTNPATTCTNSAVVMLAVSSGPTMTVTNNPSSLLCSAGASATLTATGTSTAYAWSTSATTSSIVVTPTATTVYTVTGTNNCGTKTTVTTVSVGLTPTITATPASSLVCANNPAVLTANATAGTTYSWSTGSSATSVTVTPSQTTTYTVTATNACGTATATVVQNVSACVGIEEIAHAGEISIYPNPASDYVSISVPANIASANTTLEVTDAVGKLVMTETISRDITTLRLTELKEGVYFFKVITNNQPVKVGKVVKH